MAWLWYALIAGLFFASSRVVSRLFLRKQGNALAFTAISDFIAGFVLVPLLIFGWEIPNNFWPWIFFAGIVIFAFLSDWLSFTSLKLIDVSAYQILNQLRHVFIIFAGFFIFAESLSINKFLAVFIIIAGVLVMLYERGKFYWSKGALLAILSTLAAVVAFIFAKLATQSFSESFMAASELMLIGVLGFVFLGFNPKKISGEWKTNKWGLVFSGILFGLFELFLFLALDQGDISKVIPVTQSALVFGVLMGIFLLKEKSRLWQKIIGMLIIIGGIILIYFV